MKPSVIASILAVSSIYKVSSQPISDKLSGSPISHLLTKDVYYFYEPIEVDTVQINRANDSVTINGKYEVTNRPGDTDGEGCYADEATALAITIKRNEVERERHTTRMDELKRMQGFLEDALRLDSEAAKKLKK